MAELLALHGVHINMPIIYYGNIPLAEVKSSAKSSDIISITIPSSVTSLGTNCFYGCSSLTSITIPSSVTSLGSSCFNGCYALTSITIPSAVTSLPNYCFSGCSSLTSITIPSSVTSLGGYCFNNCSSLTSITIPSAVTFLPRFSFSGCSNLTKVYFAGNPPTLGEDAFSGDNFTAFTPSPATLECLLHLSAQGLTTSGISAANGVVDISGRGNHGQAYNGVSVTTTTNYGNAFGFPNNNSYIDLIDKKTSIFTQGNAYTFSASFYITEKPTRSNGVLVMWVHSVPLIQIWLTSDYKIRISSDNGFAAYTDASAIELNTLYTVTVSCDYLNGARTIYINGSPVSTATRTAGALTVNVGYMVLGNHKGSTGYNLPGYIIDARIYGKALNDAEVAQLYKSVQWTPHIKSSTYGSASSVTWATVPTGAILTLDPLTSATGSNGIKDISGSGYHGTLTSSATIDKADNAFVFDGATNSKIEVTNSSFLSSVNGKTALTLSVAAKCTNSNKSRVGGFISNASTGYLFGFFLFTSTSVSFQDRLSSTSDTIKSLSATITSGVYHTATATVDYVNGIAILYIDGVEKAKSTAWFKGTKANVTALRFGQSSTTSSSGYQFQGSVKNVNVYNRVLTPAEVAALHDNTISPPLVLAYKINQVNTATVRYVIDYAEDATNYTPITYSGTTPNMGSWESWINAHFTPVMLKSNGTVDYELNRNNLNYKADGTTASNVSNTSYDGNAMLRIKKFYISCSSETVGSGSDAYTVHTIKMCDSKINNTYTCWGFVDANGNEKDYVYYALYNCHKDSNNKLRSISGVTLNDSRPGNQLLSYNDMVAAAKANGTGWDISNLALENAIGLVMMMIYKSVNPTFINQEYVDLYRQSMSVYQVTGTRNADGGFPHVTASQKQKALWIESFWRNYDTVNQSRPWINGLASLRTGTGSNDFMPYYRKQPPYDDFTTISNWTPMSSTTPHAYMSDAVSHELKTVMFYDNIMFPKDDGVVRQGSITEATINRYFGGGEISGSTSTSLQYTDRLLPAQTCGGVMQDQYSSMPHYLGYSLVGTGINNYQKYGSGRLIYMPS
ncbi:MAG: leucine-rich repeat protein [Pseudobutyrivibrio sp.]|nr:leucine-rich repeat protein [Pseudobutyrivibrio sp.]